MPWIFADTAAKIFLSKKYLDEILLSWRLRCFSRRKISPFLEIAFDTDISSSSLGLIRWRLGSLSWEWWKELALRLFFTYSVAMLRSHLLCDNPTKEIKRLKNSKCFLLKLIWLLQNADRKWIWQCATVQNIQKYKVELFWLDKNTCAWKTA